MSKKLKKNEKRKKKVIKLIEKLKNKINLKEKKLSKINIKIGSIEKRVAEKKNKKLAKKKTIESSASVNN